MNGIGIVTSTLCGRSIALENFDGLSWIASGLMRN